MSDKLTLDRIELLHPAVREEAKEIYNEICERLTGKATCRFAFTTRTFAEQNIIYAQGRTSPGKIVTRAKAGQSWHNYGLAIDTVLLIDNDGKITASYDTESDFDGDKVSDWSEVVYVFTELFGWEWGGNFANFKDMPHFQKRFGMTISQALSRYNTGQVISGTNYIKLP